MPVYPHGFERPRIRFGNTGSMYDPRRGFPHVVPYCRYTDPEIGIRWLTEVVGAREALRLTLSDGRVGHAEFILGSSVFTIGLSLTPPGDLDPTENRFTLRQMTLVFVDDVDAAVDRAHVCGGSTVDPPSEQPWGLRQAIVRDPEGYLWELSQHVKDVDPSAWGAELLRSLPG